MAKADSAGTSGSSLLQSCLPLPLQDLCLLVVINDLDSYPVDLLASMPRWLRYRLLNNLPVLDFCRLEQSAIAGGVDLSEIWSSRWKNPRIPHPFYQPPLSNTIRSDYHYNIKDADCLRDLEPELVAAFQQLSNKEKMDAKQKYLLQVASDVLDSTEFDTDLRALTIVPADWLISMKGDRLLQDLTEAKHNPHQARSRITYVNTSASSRTVQQQSKVDVDAYKQIWESQTTALARYEQDDVRLAPHRLLPIRERGDPLEQLSLLINDCGLQPLSVVHLGLTRMTNSQQWNQCIKEGENFGNILKHILHQVVVLGMQCDHVNQPSQVLQTIMEAVLADREQCRLRYLFSRHVTVEFMKSLSPHFYTLPSNTESKQGYQGLSVIQLGMSDLEPISYISALLEQQPLLKCVQLDFDCGSDGLEARSNVVQLFSTLSSLFFRPQFLFLKLELKSECTIVKPLLQELLCGFMKAPCATTKQLTITSESSDPTLVTQKEVELASVDLGSMDGATVPDCGVQHKKLSLSANLQSVVGSLLQLSTIRVRNIRFDCSHDSYPYLHQAALHPDLQVISLGVQFQLCPYDRLLTTVENDLVTLFKKPALERITLFGYWGYFEEIKSAVVKGLHQRAKVGALRQLTLAAPQTNVTRRHSKDELRDLWNAILSLPQLDKMELVVAGDIYDLILRNEDLVYESWEQISSHTRLKQLQLVKYSNIERNEDHDKLSKVTQTLLFTNKPVHNQE